MTSDDALMPPMKPDVKTSTGIVRGRWEDGSPAGATSGGEPESGDRITHSHFRPDYV